MTFALLADIIGVDSADVALRICTEFYRTNRYP